MRVGYCAIKASDFRKCLEAAEYDEKDSYFESPDIGFRPMFLETKLAAITWQRKEAMRKLGAAPSVADKPVKARLRHCRQEVTQIMSETEYAILTLHTQKNLAEACSTRQLVVEEGGGYSVLLWHDPCHELPFLEPASWSLEVEPLEYGYYVVVVVVVVVVVEVRGLGI